MGREKFVEGSRERARKLGATVLADKEVQRPSNDPLAEIAVLQLVTPGCEGQGQTAGKGRERGAGCASCGARR